MTEQLLNEYLDAHCASVLTFNRKEKLLEKLNKQNEKMQTEIRKKVRSILTKTPWLIDDVSVSTVINPWQAPGEQRSRLEVNVSISKANTVADFLRTQISFNATSNDVGPMLHELNCFVSSL